jgi:acylphosphatase
MKEENCQRAHIFVKGYVQGVSFRAFVKRWADEIKISGWVKNLLNGDVEVVAEGDEHKIFMLIDKIKQGPIGSEVHDVEIRWERPKGENGFKIIH